MANEQLTDKIEAWLQGKLLPAEAAAFEAEIAADPALAEDVDLHRLALQAMDHLSEQHLQQNVLTWLENVNIDSIEDESEKEPDLNTEPPAPSASYRNWFWIATTLLLLTGALAFYQIWKSGIEKQRIATLEAEIRQQDSLLFELKQRPIVNQAAIDSLSSEKEQLQQQLQEAKKGTGKPKSPRLIVYYEKPKNLGRTLRDVKDLSVKKHLKDGAEDFEKSDMKAAETEARKALAIEPDNREARRLLAHSLFGQQRYFEAEMEFSQMQKEYAKPFDGYYEAEWNLLLCYRALSDADAGQRTLFNTVLDKILNDSNHPYHNLAKQVDEADRKNGK